MKTQADIVVETEGLTRRFGEKVAVDGLTLTIGAGEIFGFLGHNGAGKTTTVRLLNGVLPPSGGRARVLGLSPTASGPALRRRTGVLTETPSLEERLSARENLRVFADLFGVPRRQVDQRVDELLEAFDLAERADDKVGSYSKGMKQRLALARALIHRPQLLFLDEPTSGLDPLAARRVHELIVRLSREEGRTVFLCTHNLVEAEQLCDRVAVLEHGRLVAMGTPAELARQTVAGRRVEFEVKPTQRLRAVSVLQAAGVAKAAAEENGVVVVQGAERDIIPELLAALVRAQISVYRVAPREASLEDVYFALHGEEARA